MIQTLYRQIEILHSREELDQGQLIDRRFKKSSQ